MSSSIDPDAVMRTERLLPFDAPTIFAAFANPDLLARWWGPSGFTNTFERCEFVPGGRWVFTMHGPNGIDYPNESVFREIEPNARIVIDHVCPPVFTLTVTLTPQGDGTYLMWVEVFASAEIVAKLRPIVGDANEQNLDRLEAVLANEAR